MGFQESGLVWDSNLVATKGRLLIVAHVVSVVLAAALRFPQKVQTTSWAPKALIGRFCNMAFPIIESLYCEATS